MWVFPPYCLLVSFSPEKVQIYFSHMAIPSISSAHRQKSPLKGGAEGSVLRYVTTSPQAKASEGYNSPLEAPLTITSEKLFSFFTPEVKVVLSDD